MGNNSPSRYRREGRQAFYRGGDPATNNPYPTNSYNASNWLEGWKEAEKDDAQTIEREQAEEQADEAKLEEFVRLYDEAKKRGMIT